jgi:hypothetical protein
MGRPVNQSVNHSFSQSISQAVLEQLNDYKILKLKLAALSSGFVLKKLRKSRQNFNI